MDENLYLKEFENFRLIFTTQKNYPQNRQITTGLAASTRSRVRWLVSRSFLVN